MRRYRGIYCMDLTNDRELLINLAYHLQSTVNKRGNGQHYANPILEDVRSKYPFVFELAITFRDYFLQKLGIALDESETAYIAVHLGAAVERLKMQNGTHKLESRAGVPCKSVNFQIPYGEDTLALRQPAFPLRTVFGL